MDSEVESMEFIDIENDDFEEIERRRAQNIYKFPTVGVYGTTLGFNIAAYPLLDGWTHICFYTTPEYVIMTKASKNERNAFALRRYFARESTGYCNQNVTIPADLKEKKLRHGVYKLYKCKQGLAFKRYEPLEVKDAAP